MAEALAKKWLELKAPSRGDIEISSAGLAAFDGSMASQQAIKVMGENHINLTGHRARLLNDQMVRNCDLIIAMTQSHKGEILRRYSGARGKLFTLAEIYEKSTGRPYGAKDITDPFGQSVDVYRQCAGNIEGLIDGFLTGIIKRTS